MSSGIAQRVRYRVWQFASAIRAGQTPLSETQIREVQGLLPEQAWPLFAAMPRHDQRHAIDVLHTLQASGEVPPPLAQAALLHDCAKHRGGIRLWHRVAVVLVRVCAPGRMEKWCEMEPLGAHDWRHPFWAHVHHPENGARLAEQAACDPLAVTLIRFHGETPPPGALAAQGGLLLDRLRTADDDN